MKKGTDQVMSKHLDLFGLPLEVFLQRTQPHRLSTSTKNLHLPYKYIPAMQSQISTKLSWIPILSHPVSSPLPLSSGRLLISHVVYTFPAFLLFFIGGGIICTAPTTGALGCTSFGIFRHEIPRRWLSHRRSYLAFRISANRFQTTDDRDSPVSGAAASNWTVE